MGVKNIWEKVRVKKNVIKKFKKSGGKNKKKKTSKKVEKKNGGKKSGKKKLGKKSLKKSGGQKSKQAVVEVASELLFGLALKC